VPTSSSARAGLSPVLVVLTAACALLAGAVGLAGPAAAIEDPRRPTAEVTSGPSCGPAVVRVAVTNGTEAHTLVLVVDDAGAQGSADLGPGETAELTSGDVDWGQTVEVAVAVTDLDGTAEESLRLGTYTRPSAEDCAAVTAPEATADPTPAPPSTTDPAPTASSPSAPTGTEPTTSTPPSTSALPTRPTFPGGTPWASGSSAPTTRSTTPASSSSSPAGSGSGAEPTDDPSAGQAGSATAASVAPGGVVTVRAAGFTPGESVTVSLLGADAPLTTVAADPGGKVEAVVQIPRDAALGSATVQLVGGASDAVAGLPLEVAARSRPAAAPTTAAPGLAPGLGLIGAAGLLGLTAVRRSRRTRT
jgi:hypothetical protein